MIWGQVTAYFTNDCWREGSAEQWRGIRRQETHAGAGAFPASAPHNCGNDTHLLTSGNDAHVNTHIPSLTTMSCALRLADITGRAWVCRSGLSGPVESVPTANAQSSVISELTRLFCWADEVWRGHEGEWKLALSVCKLQNGGCLFFYFTTPAPGGPLHDLKTGKMQIYMIRKSFFFFFF